MAFHDQQLPPSIEYQSISGPGFATIVQQTASGHEFRVSRTSQGRHRFRLRKALQSQQEAIDLKAFMLARRGSLHSFRLKDWLDYSTASTGTAAPTSSDVIIGTGDGTNTQFQLIKVYNDGGPSPYQRTISCPVTGTTVVAVDGVATTDFSVSTAGVVTMDTAPSVGQVVRAGCEFDVPVRFTQDVDKFLQVQSAAFELWDLVQLDCIEVLDEVEHPDRWFAGGGVDHGTVSGTVVITTGNGVMQSMDPENNAVTALLPSVVRLAGGGQLFVIHNASTGSGTVQLVDELGQNQGTAIAAGATKTVGLARPGGSGSPGNSLNLNTAKWFVY
tara:strand:- start:80 stop:1069 length:990 start_codon:yes stop_codon:yes gene_type:complete